MAGTVCSSRSWRATGARSRASISAADAAFANPEVYEFLEAERIKYAIRLPANHVLQEQDRLPAQAPGRPTAERGASLLCQLHLSGGKLDQAAPGGRQGRVASRSVSCHAFQEQSTGGMRSRCQ